MQDEKNEITLPKIWIDADSCPKPVRDIAIRFSRRMNPGIKVVFVANREIPARSKEHEMVVCEKEKDSADNYILIHASQSDMVITKDILFAEKLVEKEICAINDRGTYFSKDNIDGLVEDRNFNLQLAEIGFAGTSRRSYSKKHLEKFIKCFEEQLSRLLRKAGANPRQESRQESLGCVP